MQNLERFFITKLLEFFAQAGLHPKPYQSVSKTNIFASASWISPGKKMSADCGQRTLNE